MKEIIERFDALVVILTFTLYSQHRLKQTEMGKFVSLHLEETRLDKMRWPLAF